MASKTESHDSPIPPLNKNPRNPPVGAKRKSRYRGPVKPAFSFFFNRGETSLLLLLNWGMRMTEKFTPLNLSVSFVEVGRISTG